MKTCLVWAGGGTRRLPFCFATVVLSVIFLGKAQADGLDYAQAGQAQSLSSTPEAVASPALGGGARFDQLQIKAWNIPLPGAADTIDEDPLGLRSTLADAGIGYFGFTN